MTRKLNKYLKETKTNFIRNNIIEFVTTDFELYNKIENLGSEKMDFLRKAKHSDRYILMENCSVVNIRNHENSIFTIRMEYGKITHMDLKELRLYKLKTFILND